MKLQFVTIFSLLLSFNLFAHGMNKHGPNGGYIRMPGAFHTELVDKGAHYNIHILDMGFKPASADGMTISAQYKGEKEIMVACEKTKNMFVCAKPDKDTTKYTTVNLSITKNGKATAPASYSLPLKLQ